jgi:hypothetical protein
MPVKTRSQLRSANIQITTSSFLESCKRTYKVYSPRKRVVYRERDYDENEAIEALLALQEYDDEQEQEQEQQQEPLPSSSSASSVQCMNPMCPVTKYIYRIGVYNINQTVHYKTAFILFDPNTRLFHIHTIISNILPSDNNNSDKAEIDTSGWYSLPLPKNTIQTKYTTYISETAVNFVKTMIIPSDEHDYYIQDDILGLVISNREFHDKVFSVDSSYYDIENIIYDETSSETTNGFKAYMLVPSRNFWYSPFGSYYTTVPETCQENKYTTLVIETVLLILSQSN